MNTAIFETGKIVATSLVVFETNENKNFANFCFESLNRHKNGDWGDLQEEDLQLNNLSLEDGEGRILSSYNLPENISVENESKIWIITEADRSVTTILFPSQY